VCIHANLSPEWFDGRYKYSVFQSLSSHKLVPGEYQHSNSKVGGLQMGSNIKMAMFSKIASTILIKFQIFIGTISLNKAA
jgi:hypothetical protein